jgi:UDP-N-acetylglucosamine 2-epimerase (non-hydrolysing)
MSRTASLRIVVVAGARPNFMKIAPLMEEFRAYPNIETILVHTGQHYDEKMSDLFFQQLGIPQPDTNLGIGSGSHAQQTAEVMKAFEPVVLQRRPDAVLVVGDVNSTVACGLVAVKLGVKLLHVEAGLRSFDRSMPEEINRLLTDAISHLLFCSEPAAVENLRCEGISGDRVHLVGNVMIDTLLKHREAAERSGILEQLGLAKNTYVVVTMHRPSNVDNVASLRNLLQILEVVQQDTPIVFPVHPRTRKNLAAFGLISRLGELPNLRMIQPVGYLDFLKLMSWSTAVFTDSGGIQEETTILKIPCLTLRSSTERPITSEIGSSRVVGSDPQRVLAAWQEVKEGCWKVPQTPPLWDGHAAQRITAIIADRWAMNGQGDCV